MRHGSLLKDLASFRKFAAVDVRSGWWMVMDVLPHLFKTGPVASFF